MAKETVFNITEGEKKAKIFLPRTEIDKETIKQIRHMVNDPTAENVRIMPDGHKGAGCCIGFTSKLNRKIVPRFIGVDIGCGITSCKVPGVVNIKDRRIRRYERIIRQVIPMGGGRENINAMDRTTKEDMEWLYSESQAAAMKFAESYEKAYGEELLVPTYGEEWFLELSEKIRSNHDYDMKSLGSLGSGNHYVEINENSKGEIYITVHSGSRNLGTKVCHYHQQKIDETKRFDHETFNHELKKIKRDVKHPKTLKEKTDELRAKINELRHPPYLEDKEASDYYFDMIFTQKYAQLNRRIMIKSFLEMIEVPFLEENIVESIHNYIDFEDFIIRKGAIRASEGKLCIISLNMRDGILLCRGKGNSDWNNSSAHGCGRILTRQQAKRKMRLKDVREEMAKADVYTTTLSEETLDESPAAYRDAELIKEAIGPSVEIVEQLRPIINVKGN
jgi:RNA-splicing ligase RtcB